MALLRGDVVLVSFPFSSGTGGKLRPAVVVQADDNNRRLTNVILVPITTTTHRRCEVTQLLIELESPAGEAAGLRHTSVATCENISTVVQSLVQRRLGRLLPDTLAQLDDRLREALGLS